MEFTQGHRKVLIGAVMGGVLLLQAVATFGALAGLHARKKFWPWTDYPMYEQKYVAGDPIDVTGVIYIVLGSGGRIPITADMLGIGFWRFFHLFNRLSTHEEPSMDDLDFILKATTTESEIVAIETYHYPLAISKNGPVVVDERLRKRIDIE